MRKLIGWMAFGAGAAMLIAPQAAMGLTELRWLDRYAFSGEVLVAMIVLALGYYLLDIQPQRPGS